MANDLFKGIDKTIRDLEEGTLEIPEELKPLLERAVAEQEARTSLTPDQIQEWASYLAESLCREFKAAEWLGKKIYWNGYEQPGPRSAKFEIGTKQKLPAPEDLIGVETECLIDTHPEMGSDFWKQNPMCTIHVEDPKE